MGSFILTIANYLWVICVLTLIIALLIPTDKSSRLSVAIWIAIGLIMDRTAPYLLDLSAWDANLGRHVWYSAWAAFNTVTILLIWSLHQRYKWQLSKLSQYICLCCLAMVGLQALRLLDRVAFETNLLADIYKYGVPAINIAVIAAILAWVAHTIIRMRKGIEQ